MFDLSNNLSIDINQLIISLVIVTISILVGIDSKKIIMKEYDNSIRMDKDYLKKFILVNYIIILFFINLTNIDNIYLPLLVILIQVVAGINLSNIAGSLSRDLKFINFTIYFIIEWFIISKSYILLLLSIILSIFTFDNYINSSLVFIFLLYHLIANARDLYNFKSFDELQDKILKRDDSIKVDSHLISFIIYIEDKDFLKRKGVIYNPLYSVKRRWKNFRDKSNHRINSQFNLFKRAILKLKSLKRGYSTIQGQFIRNLALGEDSYRYTIRRKLHLEVLYTSFLYIACKKRYKRYYKISLNEYITSEDYITKNEIASDLIKYNTLLSYYKNILNGPEDIETLKITLANHSRLNIENVSNEYEKFLKSKTYKKDIEKINYLTHLSKKIEV